MPHRQPNGHAAPYRGADDFWHCHVTVGHKADGTPDRRHVRRRTQKACADQVETLRRQAAGGKQVVSKAPTLGEWLDHWLETIVKPNRSHNTHVGYEVLVRRHLKPRIGHWRIGGSRKLLQPEHLDACYAAMKEAGYAPAYILQAHRILSRSLKVAVRRGRANRNTCDLVDAPSLTRRKPKPLSMESTKKVIAVATDDRLAARWLTALLLGLRQGEVLGLRWRNIDLDGEAAMLRTEKQAQRRTWRHGCDDLAACTRRHCRTAPCPPSCRRHRGKNGCPPPCATGCTRHARACPQRTGGGVVFVDLKSDGSERAVPLDPYLVRAFREHRRRQLELWMSLGLGRVGDDDLVFTSELGRPVDARRDHEAWERLLVRAGVPDAALHAARHTAATLLVATGTDISVVQEVLGHSDIRTARGYTDVAAELKRAAVERMATVLFGGAFDPLVQQPNATGQGRR